MLTLPNDSRCARCGVAASKRKDTSLPPLECAQCRHVDVVVSFCNQACYDAAIERHRKTACVGPKTQSIFVDDAAGWKRFSTPACRVEFVTPRLRLRPVELSDNDRLFCIKTDPLVYRTQLYGEIATKQELLVEFTSNYAGNCVPTLSSTQSRCKGRQRYMFAVEPRVDKNGVRMVQPNAETMSKHDLDAEGFIGSIGLVIEPNTLWKDTRIYPFLEPKPGQIFRYSPQALEPEAHGEFLYELHPKFWQQGIATEIMKPLMAFAFTTLQLPYLIINPLSQNPASIALAKKLGFTYLEKVKQLPGAYKDLTQEVYKLTKEEWAKGKKGKGKKKAKAKPVAEATNDAADDPPEVALEDEGADNSENPPTCRWCQVPSNEATLGCSGCDWAFWCSQPCKTADLLFKYGHSLECPGKGGDPKKPAPVQDAKLKSGGLNMSMAAMVARLQSMEAQSAQLLGK